MNRDQRETARLVKKILEERKEGKVKLTYTPKKAESRPSTNQSQLQAHYASTTTTTPSLKSEPTLTASASKPSLSNNTASNPSGQQQEQTTKKVNLFENHFGCFLISVFIGAFVGALIVALIFANL